MINLIQINDNKIKNKIYYLSILGFALLSFPNTFFGGLIPVISKYLNTSIYFIGIILAIFGIMNLIGAAIAGNLIELFGIRKVVIIGINFEIISMIALSFVKSGILFNIFYSLSGFGVGYLGVALNSLVSKVFEKDRSKRLMFLGMASFLGVILGAFFINLIISFDINWRSGFLISGIFFILYLFATIKSDSLKLKVSSSYNIRMLIQIYKSSFLNVNLVIIGIISFLFNGIASVFLNWFTTYFKNFNITVAISSIFIIFYAVGMIAGMALKVFMFKFIKEDRILILNSVVVFICFLGLIFFNNLIFKILLIIIIGLSSAGIFMLCATISMNIRKENLSLMVGYIYASAYGGNIFLIYISGLIVEKFPKLGLVTMCCIVWALISILSIISFKLGSKITQQKLIFFHN